MTLQMIRFLMLPRDHYLVLEEALARAFAQLAFVEHLLEDGCHGLKVVGHHHLFEQRAHQARHLLILHDDVVGHGTEKQAYVTFDVETTGWDKYYI